MENYDQFIDILKQVKALSRKYRSLTGRPLGCTGEVAEIEAVRLLGLELAPVRQAGYDAVRHSSAGEERVQIKGRCILPDSKRSQRLGRIDITKEWDTVVLVLLDEHLDAMEIFEARRDQVINALEAPGSRSRNERGALGIRKFKQIGSLIWSRKVAPTIGQT